MIFWSCLLPSVFAQTVPVRPSDDHSLYLLYLIGNTGTGATDQRDRTLAVLKEKLDRARSETAVVFLGDQLGHGGLPEINAADRTEKERDLDALMSVVSDFSGRIFFIPGESDYGVGDNRLDALIRQETYIETKLNRGNVFIPDAGFPGPSEIKIADGMRLVALNTSWLLEENPSPVGKNDDFEIRETADVYSRLEDIVLNRHTDDLIVVGHHPVMSNGRYAGHFGRSYLIPIIGTALFAGRRLFRREQYFGGERNEWMRKRLFQILTGHENMIYASAHDFSLQRFESERMSFSQSFIVSGSAARSEHVEQFHEAKGYDTMLASPEPGFTSIQFYTDGSIWMDAWSAAPGKEGLRIYEGVIREPEVNTAELDPDRKQTAENGDATRIVAANPGYRASALHKWFWGSNWRSLWEIPVELNTLDLSSEKGGLVAVKRGGGMQTLSVRLENPDELQFVVRSVIKDGERVLPPAWQGTFVGTIINDIMSFSHPYSVLPIPALADAVGIYHTNPRVVWVPPDLRLGKFSDFVGGSLMVFEERPNKDMSHEASFGNSEDVVGWAEMYSDTVRDNDDRVDVHFMARNRLFDMWISDWDRHKDQWRWAAFKDPDRNGKLYRPIPRDRDNAFMRLNPFMYPILKPFIKFQDFRENYGIKGLATNGRWQDHRFLGKLSRDEWIAIADSMQVSLTDQTIEDAFNAWPAAIVEASGEEMLRIAKVRRDKLSDVAEQFYALHARSVDVLGSNKHERFEVTRLNDEETLIVVYRITEEGEIRSEMYRRTIKHSETREVNLYGLGGNDHFVVTGRAEHGVIIHAVGGAGNDHFFDDSYVTGPRKLTRFFDSTHPGNTFSPGNETHITRSDDPKHNAYTGEYEFEQIYPVPLLAFDSEDGFTLTLLGLLPKQGFRQSPSVLHTFSVSFTTQTHAFSGTYEAISTEAFDNWDSGVRISYADADNTINFYGLGNETPEDRKDLFTSGLSRFFAGMPFQYQHFLGLSLEFVPGVESSELTQEKFELLEDISQPGLSAPQKGRQWFSVLYSTIDFKYVDQTDNPLHGFHWDVHFDGHVGLTTRADSYFRAGSFLSLYTSLPTKRQVTFAGRVGGDHIFGTFPFYEASTLGGRTNLRGYQSSRFSGRSSLFINTDLRVELFRIRRGFLPGRIGMIVFFDVGRVWTDEEKSSIWHAGYGLGIWYNIVDEMLVSFSSGKSDGQNYFSGGVGFFF